MKTFKMICTATVLALALSFPGYGGEINTPGFTCDPCESATPEPTPQPDSDSLIEMSSGDFFDASTNELMALLLTLSALF